MLTHTRNTLLQARYSPDPYDMATSQQRGTLGSVCTLLQCSGSSFVSRVYCCANGQVVHDLFLEDLALAHVISQEQSKAVIKRNRVVEEAEEETAK